MKNDNLPIIQALKARNKPKAEGPYDHFNPPRTFEIKHNEIPGLPGKKVGEGISVHLKGKVHMQHADGHAVMHVNQVSAVKPDSDEMLDKTNPEATA